MVTVQIGPPFIVSWNFMNEICVVRLNHSTEGEVVSEKKEASRCSPV